MVPRWNLPRWKNVARGLSVMALVACGLVGPGQAAAIRAGDGTGAGASGPSYVVRAARLYTGHDVAGGCLHDGWMIVRNGRIEAVGEGIEPPPDLDLLDLREGVVVPGLVLADGLLVGQAAGKETTGAQYAAIDAWDFFAERSDLLAGGITTVYLSPGRNRLISGQGAIVKVAGGGAAGRTVANHSGLVVNTDEAAFNPPPLVRYPIPPSSDNPFEPGLRQPPTSRIGVFYELNRALERAAVYRAARAGMERPEFDAARAALGKALDEGLSWRIRAMRADDIYRAALFAESHGRKAVITGARQSGHIAGMLGHQGVDVILEVPLHLDKLPPEIGNRRDPLPYDPSTAAKLARAGVRFAITVDAGQVPSRLLDAAASAVQAGLSREQALQKITSHAAAILGVGDRVGSLAAGRDADFVVLSDDPFALDSHVNQVFVSGKRVYRAPAGAVARTGNANSALVVKAGTVLTGTGETLRPGEVLVEDGKIVAMGERVGASPGARVVDGGPGSYLVAGFIDSHSHLGFVGDRASVGSDTRVADVLGADTPETRRVAAAGVTTAVLAPYRVGGQGGRVAALATLGAGREQMVVDPVVGLKFSALNLDPVGGFEGFRRTLKAAKQYDEKWRKYEEALAKWEAAQRGEGDEAAKKAEEKKPAPKPAAEKPEQKTEKRSDPITGKWEFTISGGPLPEPSKGTLYLKLDGTTITGKADSPMGGEEVEVTGTLNGNQVVIELQAETPFGPPTIEGTIDREDHITATLKIGDYVTLDVDATRVEKKEFDVVVVTKKRRAKGASDKPQPPPVDERQEPFRKLFAGKAPALIEANDKLVIEKLLDIFVREFKLRVVLLNAFEAYRMIDRLRADEVGVILETRLARRMPRGEWLVPAVILSRAGIPVAFQSDGGDAARGLRELAIAAVRRGMSPDAALQALTSNPARFFGLEKRVGAIAPGLDGDLVLFTGHPLELSSMIERVFVRGREVSLDPSVARRRSEAPGAAPSFRLTIF